MRVFRDLQKLPEFQRTVLTIGSFDGVHVGHRQILERVRRLARECGGQSMVITFDPHPRTVLRPADPTFKLLTTTDEKTQLLETYGIDNVVVVPFSQQFSEQTAKQYVEEFLLQKFSPRYVVIGYDHRFGAGREGDISFLKKYERPGQFEVVEIPAQEIDEIAVSSSKIRRALDATDVQLANRLLGHPFQFSGAVVEGDKIGRSIGFPTANLAITDPHKLVLPNGIYAAHATVRGQQHSAMLYIGDRPTVAQTAGSQKVEVNILDFDADIYGENLTVEVVDFIRADKKLDGLEALKQQIEADKKEILGRLTNYDLRITNHEPAIVNRHSEIVNPPSVAVVILNYNTRRHLETYLPSVIAHSPGARIVVADNGSPDDSIQFLKTHFPTVQVIDLQRNYGFAEGYNQALRQVDAEIYVILNSDVEVTPGWMEPVLAAMQADPTLAIAQPKIMAWRAKDRFEYAGAAGGWIDFLGYPFCRGRIFNHLEADGGQYDTPQSCFWAAGAAFFIRAKLYHAFGGFDGDYFAHNEEIDLCWRLKRAGYDVRCLPASTVYHLGGGTLEYENPRKVYLNFRNSLFTLLKNESFGKLLWLIPARLVLDGVAGGMFFLKGQWGAIWAIVRGHFSFYRSLRRTLAKRRAAAQIIEKERIAPKMNRSGVFVGSIVFKHYLQRVKEFSRLAVDG